MTMMTTPPLDQEDEEMLVPHSDFVEGPQSMEVVPQVESSSTVENQPVEDPPSSRFTWTIENFSRLNTKKHYSDVFVVGSYKWRVLIFPKGNNVDHLSMYLDVADSSTLPYGWSRYAQFSLSVVNQIHNKYTIRKETQHQFNARESDWGFTSFMPLGELYDPGRGYLVNDTCIVEAEVVVRRVLDYWAYDSKKETGYVGLKNQGATSYMNSLLQTLYHIPYFRKAVYHMPTENDMPSGSITLALQRLFYKLQYNDHSVATKELTKSFGWDTYDSFMQHDVQELNRVLCEKLEDKMKGTVVEGTIQKLFEGHHMNYIECINVDYKSTRKESFYDLQLDVKGCRDVYASFDKYVEVERLEGDNKYHAEEHGLQDAKKGVLFIDFPPVLQLQLKRFEYDFMLDTMVKINDRYEFPLQLDLDRENGKYLSPEADRSVRNLYTLHSVLVHSGGVHGGHYYAYIRPTLSDQWFKFDDERVTKEDLKRALEEQYGGEEELPQTNPGFNNTPFKFTKYSNAYMLVYIRESDKDKIICNVDEKDIAEHLRIRLKKEQEEKEDKRRYKAQARLYTIIKVAQNEDLLEQIGRDIYFDLVDHDKVRSFRIQNQMPFNLFKEEVAKEFGIPVQYLRFWIWAKRQNHTYRPDRPLTPQEEAQSVGQLREVSNKKHNAELKLFLEVELGPDLHPVPLPDKTKEDILLFFKLYDPEKEELRYVGRLFVKSSSKPIKILTKLNGMAGFAPEEEIELYEEIMFEPNVMCEHLDKRTSFRFSQIEDGDIICFQKSPPLESEEQCRYPVVPLFLEYVHNRQIVHFRSLERSKEDDFCLELSKLHSYDEVVERVARRIGLDDPSKIRLTAHNCYSQQPKPQPIKYQGVEDLSDMLIHYNQTSDILYYEVLDIPLPELKGLKSLKVAFHQATKDEVVILNIRLPKQSTVGDVINELKTKVELSHPNAELRLLKVFNHKIYKIFPASEKIENINDQYWTLRAEEVLSSTTVDPGIFLTPRATPSPTLSHSPPSPGPTHSLAIIPHKPLSPPVFPYPIITPPVSPVKVTVGTISSPPSLVSSRARPLSPSPFRSRQPSATPIISAFFSAASSKPASSSGPSAQLPSIEAILSDDWLSDAEEVPPRPIIEDSEVIQARLVIKNALNQNLSYFLDTAAFDSFTKACTLLVSSPEIANPTKTFLATLPTSLQNAAINAYTAQTLLSQFKLLEAHNKTILGQMKEHNDKLQSASLSRHQLLQSQQDISNQIKELQAQLAVVGDKLSSVDQELLTLAQATNGLVTSAVSSKADLKRSVAVRGEAQDTIAFCEQVLSRAKGDSRLFL